MKKGIVFCFVLTALFYFPLASHADESLDMLLDRLGFDPMVLMESDQTVMPQGYEGGSNTFYGFWAGENIGSGGGNAFFGAGTGYYTTYGEYNSFFGDLTGFVNVGGDENVYIGTAAGGNNKYGDGNIFIGFKAGFNEKGSNKLYIANSGTDTPLVYGDFSKSEFKINGYMSCTAALLANNAAPWGSAPFVLGQDVGNRGIVITDKAASNQKNIYFGWNVGTSHDYAELFALQEGVGYKNLALNPNGGYVGIGTSSPGQPLQMGSGAYCSAGGTWVNASSREYKQDIKALTTDEALTALGAMEPVKFRYKKDPDERHVGFIAEDLPDLVATKDRKGMSPADVLAVLTKVVQEQQATIAKISKELKELKLSKK